MLRQSDRATAPRVAVRQASAFARVTTGFHSRPASTPRDALKALYRHVVTMRIRRSTGETQRNGLADAKMPQVQLIPVCTWNWRAVRRDRRCMHGD
jgi:hypothetical protein